MTYNTGPHGFGVGVPIGDEIDATLADWARNHPEKLAKLSPHWQQRAAKLMAPRLSWHQQRAAGWHALPYDIVGYTYCADTLCGPCTIERMIANGEASPSARGMDVEDALDQIAAANGYDRHDETSFDSDDFPKIVFRDSHPDGIDICAKCGDEL